MGWGHLDQVRLIESDPDWGRGFVDGVRVSRRGQPRP